MTTLQQERAARTPEERREDFCKAYVRSGGRLANSATAAGFPVASAAVRANELMRRTDVQERIAELLRERFVVEGTKAHSVVLALSKRSSPKDAVKLRAAQQLMEIGGLFKRSDKTAAEQAAEKQGVQSAREGYALLARAAAKLLTVPGISTGFTFDESTATVTITNAEHATDFLTSVYRGFQSDGRLNPDAKSHPEWGVWHDWKSRPSLSTRNAAAAPAITTEPVDEPEEDWIAA